MKPFFFLCFHRALHQGKGERPRGEGEEGQGKREGEEEAQSDERDKEGEWRGQAADYRLVGTHVQSHSLTVV